MATKTIKIDENRVLGNTRALTNAISTEMGFGKIENNTDLQAFGKNVMEYSTTYNAFLNNLINRIGRTIILNRYYYNHYALLKKGLLDIGETIEEIFVNLCDPSPYDVERAEREVFKRVTPDVLAAYYSINIEVFYKQTVQRKDLRKAFISFTAMGNLIRSIINSMYISLSYDEECLTKYLIQKNILNGFINSTTIPQPSSDTAKATMIAIQEQAYNLTFMKVNNFAGVPNFATLEEQFLYITTDLESLLGVEVLASSFNMDMANYRTRRILFDDFYSNDVQRLEKIFENVEGWSYFTESEIEVLKSFKAIACSQDLTQIYDSYITFDFIRNPQGLYENYFLNTGKIYALSPFAVAKAFTTETFDVNDFGLDPTATMNRGSQKQFVVNDIIPSYAQNKNVVWTLTTSEFSNVNSTGLVSIGANETLDTLTLTARIGNVSKNCEITLT